ncbi:dCMP deaminase [Streptomyces griseocarneus]|uniref:dCMP deaminase n=1 Tax=Streptomyces griseocarneus TaxID=51201 RepID=A0ABX7RV17_9ACTN|nr:dCMP deaminase [Streptomyces griseocarneus]
MTTGPDDHGTPPGPATPDDHGTPETPPGPAASGDRRASDRAWLELAIELARDCPPSTTAYSVGAVIVAADGTELARGHSREGHPSRTPRRPPSPSSPRRPPAGRRHPLQLSRALLRARLAPRACTHLVLGAGIPRVVLAWREPALFVADCTGVELLEQAGVEVVELPELADAARAVNAHLDV